MRQLMRRAAVTGVVAAMAYGLGACAEEKGPREDAFKDPINQQARPKPDPGSRPDTTGVTNPQQGSPLSQESGDPRGEGSAMGGAGMPATTAPGTSLSRADGGEPPGARGMAGSGSLGPADGGTRGMDAGTRGDIRRRMDTGMGTGTGTRAMTPDAGSSR